MVCLITFWERSIATSSFNCSGPTGMPTPRATLSIIATGTQALRDAFSDLTDAQYDEAIARLSAAGWIIDQMTWIDNEGYRMVYRLTEAGELALEKDASE